MASDEIIEDRPELVTGAASDYGSEPGDETWDLVFSQNDVEPPVPEARVEASIEDAVLPDDVPDAPPSSLRLTRIRALLHEALAELDAVAAASKSPAVTIEYDESTRAGLPAVRVEESPRRDQDRAVSVEEPDERDERSPIDRFRRPPKKTLSVTDIVSPAWCELQYWYSLTKYGRVRRTPAMKAGTKIHKQKEAEVHTEVPVELETREDRLGLRLWNIIQGLRTLRSTGLTRELELFGIVEGEVIIGIIDELSYTSPDDSQEATILDHIEAKKPNGRKRTPAVAPPDQRTMAEYTANSSSRADGEDKSASLGTLQPRAKTIYITDTKARHSNSLPPAGNQMRPTQMQLMMYHRLLSDLASNQVEAAVIFDRYNVDAYKAFSDTFLANMSNINIMSSQNSDNNDEGYSFGTPATEDGLEEIMSHMTLSSLWAFMMAEFAKTISINAASSSISPMLTAVFCSSHSGETLGQRCFAFDAATLDAHRRAVLQWWRGERRPKGVEVEEAYKCRICEFAEKCSWRADKVEEALQKARLKKQGSSGAGKTTA